jgi:hypothetical protein
LWWWAHQAPVRFVGSSRGDFVLHDPTKCNNNAISNMLFRRSCEVPPRRYIRIRSIFSRQIAASTGGFSDRRWQLDRVTPACGERRRRCDADAYRCYER